MSTKVTDLTAKSQGFIASDKFLVSKHVTQTSGVLIVGEEYTILDFNGGDNFSNVATVVSGTINTTGCVFIATGTTPTTYSNGSTLARYVSQKYGISDLGLAPKVYKALLTQSGTNAPVATVLVNTLGGTPTLTYGISGSYNAELIGGFPNGKTFVTIGGNSASSSAIFTTNRYDEDNIEIRSHSGVLADDLLSETSILIEVYP